MIYQPLRNFAVLLVTSGFCGALLAQPAVQAMSIAKQRMVEAVQDWVSETDQIGAASVTVHANDRRLRVPDCAEGFAISRPYTDAETLKVECPAINWQITLSIDIDQANPTWLFSSALPRGHQISATDLTLLTDTSAKGDTSIGMPPDNYPDIVGKILRAPVRQGQRVNAETLDESLLVYRLLRDVPAGQLLTASDIREEYVAANTLPLTARLTLAEINEARSGRDLPAGWLLRHHDLDFRQTVLTATQLIERGAALTAQNTRRTETWSSVPVDAFPFQGELPRVVATGRISPGQTIRHSQVRLLPEIVAGESVATEVVRGNLAISVQLEAVEDGRTGQQIRLRNPQSGRVISAIVAGDRRAQIR
jgi:flagella basal body P-ring formation protein FlgA